jgi:nuclear transport factor 2 (NTF2) superfamily protein
LTRPPLPTFTRHTAIQKVRLAEDAWNSREPEKVALAYTPDSFWRNRVEFLHGRDEIVSFLQRKWATPGCAADSSGMWSCQASRIVS